MGSSARRAADVSNWPLSAVVSMLHALWIQIITILCFPWLWLQGRSVRARTPRLPEATGPTMGIVLAAGSSLALLVVGESTVAGVGAPEHNQALTGQTAHALTERLRRTICWRAVGRSGATARSARQQLVPTIPPTSVDAIVLAFGVNDVLQFHSPRRWTRDLAGLIADLRARVGPAPVVLAAVPDMGQFPALPQPLRGLLGRRAMMLDRAARQLAPRLERVVYAPMPLPLTPAMFCADGFHPSPAGYQLWGSGLAEHLDRLLAA
jgi:lysophospholipase L1-like esterase